MSAFEVRDFAQDDEPSWLRCRVLGFLDTAYYDDVWTARPPTAPGLGLVAVRDGAVVGICDASLSADDASAATIHTVVVHPDHRRDGVASALLDALLTSLTDRGVTTLDAWTRDDPGAHAWYLAHGFEVTFRYLHVYASTPVEAAAAGTAVPGLLPRGGFFHAGVDGSRDPAHEADLRARFARVHRCHRFLRSVAG